MNSNPFITSGYVSPEYFCDREVETQQLIQDIQGRNNTVLISPRRIGKTGLIEHCFHQEVVRENYYCFFVDIYSTLNLADFTVLLGNEICKTLKPKGGNAIESFVKWVRSIEFRLGFDDKGMLGATFGVKEIKDAPKSLEEIFDFLNQADKPCVVAFDEFQQIAKYPEKNVEALLRTYIQHATNCMFIFAGSQRHILQNMFTTASNPFYQSSSFLSLKPIPKEKYIPFIVEKFTQAGKSITPELIEPVYDQFEGHTWYIQSIFYTVFFMTQSECNQEIIDYSIEKKLNDNGEIYESLIYSISEKQQQLLKAIAMEEKVAKPQSAEFIGKYHLSSASSVQSAIKRLIDKDLITIYQNQYMINDRFLSAWLKRKNSSI